eukprot:Tbor_TRINITY_DN6307_c0_g1::TRINITY_DN6307_c0_g1_i1::g.17817::m.17817/K07297/ADIPOR; adiponectin receptor
MSLGNQPAKGSRRESSSIKLTNKQKSNMNNSKNKNCKREEKTKEEKRYNSIGVQTEHQSLPAHESYTEEDFDLLNKIKGQYPRTMYHHLIGALVGSTADQDSQEAIESKPQHNKVIGVSRSARKICGPIAPADGSLPLYNFNELPKWMQDNEFIISSYRAHYSVSMILKSLFAIHNETANIWTHLLGLLFFIVLTAYIFITIIKPILSHYIIFLLFSFSCCMCMGCSAAFHLFTGHHSERVYSRMLMMDYFGITCLIIGSFYPLCYFAFSCEPMWRWIYMGIITSLGSMGLVGPFFDFFHQNSFDVFRLGLFICTGGVGIFPLFHVRYIMPAAQSTIVVQGIALMLLMYLIGVIVYILKIPERLCPGRFDIWLHSHQLWHMCVLSASVIHFYTCLGVYLNWERMYAHC